jgi:NAD-dependent dihydropyrimidine dehydrogenase PreA subunit
MEGGCTMKEEDGYRKLAERWDYPDSSRLLKILETTMTPEEAKLLCEMPTPTPTEDLAKKVNMSQESLEKKLRELASRGLVITGKKGHMAPAGIGQLHDATLSSAEEHIPAGIYDLWKDFHHAEWEADLIDNITRRSQTGEGLPSMRVLPAWKAIEASPGISPEQILPHENMREILKSASKLAVVACPCRRVMGDVDHPLEVCLQLNRSADYALDRGAATRELSVEEAIPLMDSVGESGLVHTVANCVFTHRIICNCCNCCCPLIGTLMHYEKPPREGMSPSRFQATVDENLCDGCQDCVEQCPFGLIEMSKFPSSKKLKAVVDAEQCMGCGVCVLKCSSGALTMELVRPPEHIPEERVIPTAPMPKRQ